MGFLMQNVLAETVLSGDSTVRLACDFGNVAEILAGGSISSCTISVDTVTVPPLTFNPGSIEIEDGYLVSALFAGGTSGNYEITFTPTLSTGQTLPNRTGTLILR